MLTEKQIKAIKPIEKTKRYFDAQGLYLEVTNKGRKYWRYKYRFVGKEKRISLGVYPETTLKNARKKRQEAYDILTEGRDPSTCFRNGKLIASNNTIGDAESFHHVAEEWFSQKESGWSLRHAKLTKQRLEKNIYPYIGNMAIAEVKPTDVLQALRAIEARGAHDVAHKTFGICSMIFRYAVASCRLDSDPSRDLKGALAPHQKGKYAAITEHKEIGPLIRSILGYEHSLIVKLATLLSAYTFCRPGEIRQAEWKEINYDEGLWLIQADKMKGKLDHVVPMSRQVVDIFRQMEPISKHSSTFVFPSMRTNDRPISDGTVNAALRYMGYSQEQMCAHGFRAMASTRLYEMGKYREEVIERQLAHVQKNKVKAAYNRAEYLDERKQMMQEWADYLDDCAGF